MSVRTPANIWHWRWERAEFWPFVLRDGAGRAHFRDQRPNNRTASRPLRSILAAGTLIGDA